MAAGFGRKVHGMQKCSLTWTMAFLIAVAPRILGQNVKLAKIALGMSEAEVKTALVADAPYYVNQRSD